MANEQTTARSRDSRGRFVREPGGLPPELKRYAAEAPGRLRAIADDPDTQAKLRVDIERFFFDAVYGRNAAARSEEKTESAPVTVRFEGKLAEWSEG